MHSCGLLRGSFRPHEVIVRVRTLHRQLSTLGTRPVDAEGAGMNVQIHRLAVTDLTGQTGMAIVRAIVDGERDPVRLAGLRDRRCKKSSREFAEHLRGNWRDEHLFQVLYDMFAAYEARIHEIQALGAPRPTRDPKIKEKAIRRRGGHKLRTTVALCRR